MYTWALIAGATLLTLGATVGYYGLFSDIDPSIESFEGIQVFYKARFGSYDNAMLNEVEAQTDLLKATEESWNAYTRGGAKLLMV